MTPTEASKETNKKTLLSISETKDENIKQNTKKIRLEPQILELSQKEILQVALINSTPQPRS